MSQLRQKRSISSSRRTTLFITAQPAPNHLVDETPTSSHCNYIGSRRVYWASHTDYPRERKRVGLLSSLKFC